MALYPALYPALYMAAALLQLAGAGPQDLAPRARAEAVLRASREQVELGEPFELVLEVRHVADDRPRVEPGELGADVAWHVLSGGDPLTLPDSAGSAGRLTEVRWSVVALEPGRRSLPAPRVLFDGLEGDAPLELEVARGELEVAGVLLPGEDAPRALPAPLGLAPPTLERNVLAIVLGCLATLLGAVALVLIARRRGRARAAGAAPQRAPLERLEDLEAAELLTPEQVREAHFALTRALRELVDGARAQERLALTDEEWAAELGDAELAQFLSSCAQVKYGVERPTHWATRERVVRARELARNHAPAAEVRA